MQAGGKIPLDVNQLKVDLVSLSAHKLHGPKGIGALYIRKGVRLSPIVFGGGQEQGLRSATENVAGIVGFGAAAELARKELAEEAARLAGFRKHIANEIHRLFPNAYFFGHKSKRLPGHLSFRLRGQEREVGRLLSTLDQAGVAVSAGSACSAHHSVEPSSVLLAMGYEMESARGLIRVSLGRFNTREHVDAFLKILRDAVSSLSNSRDHVRDDSPAEILNDIVEIIRRFVAMSPAQTDIVALWVFHTHALEAADVTGYLSITSAEKRCGKTRLLEILELLVVQPWLTGRVTAAVLVRKIDALQPTLLLDESDTALRDDSEYSDTLRGVLNLGYRRGGKTSCCVGERGSLTYQDFSVFCPKAIAGIGSLPDTIADRSFPIRLQRRAPSERVERFQRSEIEKEAETLREIVAGCGSKNFDSLKSSKADQIEALGDRENEIAMPLLAIADVAGSDWPKRARRAMLEIFTGSIVRDESIGIRLLQDIQRAFDQGESEQISSSDLLEILNADEQAPWSEFSHGKPLNHRGLSRILAKYEIRPEHFRVGPKTVRGYRRASFGNAWTRYCGSAALESGTDGTSGTDSVFNDLDVPGKIGVPDTSGTDESRGTRILFKTNDVPDVPDVPVPKSVAAKVSE